jgi:osmotically-inducible protein OsmY
MHTATELETRGSLALLDANPLATEAERILTTSGYGDLRNLRCECQDGVISIRGRLPSFFLKQMAQTLVARLSGVRRVNNQIKVT